MNSDQTNCHSCKKIIRSTTDIFHFIDQIEESKLIHIFFCSYSCWNIFLKKNQPKSK